MTTAEHDDYPLRLTIDYPEKLNRVSTAFRIIWLIPIVIVLAAVNGAVAGGPLLMILFRKKYPRWWFDWNLEIFAVHHQGRSLDGPPDRPIPGDR